MPNKEYPSPFQMLDTLYAKAREIMEAKNHDYRGGDDDPYSNFRGSSEYGVQPIIGILLRMGDKMKRVQTFVTKGTLMVKGESLDDALIDIVNYAALIRGLVQEAQLQADPTTAMRSVLQRADFTEVFDASKRSCECDGCENGRECDFVAAEIMDNDND